MRKLMIGAVVAVTALGGAAVAFGAGSSKEIGDGGPRVAFAGGPPMVVGGPGPDDEFASDLADELGISTDEVKSALKAVAEKEMAEHRRDLADSIAARLDGVTVDQVVSALEVADEKMRQAFESGDPPAPDLFTKTLSDELGVDEDEVSEALGAARAAEFKADKEKRFDFHGQLPPPPPSGGVAFAVPG